MDHRERFLQALRKKKPDKVPIFEFLIDKVIIEKLAVLLGIVQDADKGGAQKSDYVDLYCDVLEKLDLDAVCYLISTGLRNISENKVQDKYGRTYRLSTHGSPLPIPTEPCIRNLSEANEYSMVSKLEQKDFLDLQRIVCRFGKSRAICMRISDPFLSSWNLVGGMENLLLSFRENPELIHRLVRITTDFALKTIDIAVEIGVDVFLMGGDYAHETGLLFSLKDYREYFKPSHKEIVDYIHLKGKMVIKHSDGNVWRLLDDWIEVGFDGLNPIQPQCMDIKEVKEYLAEKMAVVGNIDCRDLLVSGNEEEVENAVKETIEKVAPGGGYIICSSNSIHPGCKAQNYITMVKAAHQYGIY